MTGTLDVRRAAWAADRGAIRAIREAVFVHEQGVPAELEWDAHDAGARHVLAFVDGQAIGTGRLIDDGAGASRQLLLRCPNSRHPVGRCADEAAVPPRTGRSRLPAPATAPGVALPPASMQSSRDTRASLRIGRSRLPAYRDTRASLRIGRMAVLAGFRGRGVGSALLAELLRMAGEDGTPEVWLTAQLRAEDFYARHGFVAEGGVFLDAGIPHRRMRRALAP